MTDQPTWRVLVSDPLAEEGLAILRADPQVQVTVKNDFSPEELVEAVGAYHALVVRSQTKVTAQVIEAGRSLQVIARAGVGVDNIDVPAATKRGIVVVNSPEGNTMAATEHAWALLLALSRNIPQAAASLKSGEWKRSQFTGVELYGKTLGVVGLGKIGAQVARRGQAFGMGVLAYDPFISHEQAQKLGVELVGLEELLAGSDYITLHAPLTKETRHLIGKAALAKIKPGARIINTARGGLVDEAALAEAIRSGRVAGAAVDVFEKEPPEDSPLPDLPQVIATPHLGASTQEAQIKVAVDVAEQVLDVLHGRPARSAVNVAAVSPETLARLEPYLNLAEKMGRLQAQLSGGRLIGVEAIYRGEIAGAEVGPVTSALLIGIFQSVLEEPVNLINARLVAETRGVRVTETRSLAGEDYASLISVRVTTEAGERTVSGTLFGKQEPRVVQLDGYRVDFIPEGHMLVAHHIDKPGIIGRVGTLLGENGINIAGMQVGRATPGGRAVMVLAVDGRIPDPVLQQISQVDGMEQSWLVEL